MQGDIPTLTLTLMKSSSDNKISRCRDVSLCFVTIPTTLALVLVITAIPTLLILYTHIKPLLAPRVLGLIQAHPQLPPPNRSVLTVLI